MYVVENAGNLVVNPLPWRNKAIQAAVGLLNNKDAPPVPYTADNGNVLRRVQYANLASYQEHGTGSVSGDAWFVPAVDMSLSDAKTAAREALAARRYAAETGGIVVNNLQIATDRHTQSVLTGARILAKEDANYSVNWKGPQGWLVVNAAGIIAMADAVAAHIQACFDNEKALSDQIDAAADVAAVRAVDLESGW